MSACHIKSQHKERSQRKKLTSSQETSDNCFLQTEVEVFFKTAALSNATTLQWPSTNPKYWEAQIGLIGLLDLIQLKQTKKEQTKRTQIRMGRKGEVNQRGDQRAGKYDQSMFYVTVKELTMIVVVNLLLKFI